MQEQNSDDVAELEKDAAILEDAAQEAGDVEGQKGETTDLPKKNRNRRKGKKKRKKKKKKRKAKKKHKKKSDGKDTGGEHTTPDQEAAEAAQQQHHPDPDLVPRINYETMTSKSQIRRRLESLQSFLPVHSMSGRSVSPLQRTNSTNLATLREGFKDLTKRFAFTVFVSGFCSAFQHGYQTGVVNNAHVPVTRWVAASASSGGSGDVREHLWKWSAFVSVFNLGGLVGSIIIFFITRHHSKRNGLKLNNMLVIVGAILLGFAKILNSYALFLIGRFLVGVNAGLNAGLSIMYLSEISPTALRGAVCSVYPVSFCLAILVANTLGTQWALGTNDLWPYLFVFPVAPAIVQIVGIAFCPESPKFLLIEKGDSKRARYALTYLRRCRDISGELLRIEKEGNEEEEASPTNCKEIFLQPSLNKPLRIAVLMMLAQQLTGIASVLYYSRLIFKEAGLSHEDAQISTIVLTSVHFLMSVLALFIVDHAGRRTLMYVGLSGMLVTTVGLVLCFKLVNTDEIGSDMEFLPYLSVVCLIVFVIFYSIGPGPIPWFFVSELFAQRGRTIANAIASGVNWTANFLVALVFPELFLNAIGEDVFFLFIGFQLFFLFYIYYEVPETSGKAIHKIVEEFRESSSDKSVVGHTKLQLPVDKMKASGRRENHGSAASVPPVSKAQSDRTVETIGTTT